MTKGHPLMSTNQSPYEMVGISDPLLSHSTAVWAEGVLARTTITFKLIKLANNDNITITALLRKINELFFPHGNYYIPNIDRH